jgi:hypothetical protein
MPGADTLASEEAVYDRTGFLPVELRPAPDAAGGKVETDQDDKFARAYTDACRRGDLDGYSRILSERLRQMDKRAKAANARRCGRSPCSRRRAGHREAGRPISCACRSDFWIHRQTADPVGAPCLRRGSAR